MARRTDVMIPHVRAAIGAASHGGLTTPATPSTDTLDVNVVGVTFSRDSPALGLARRQEPRNLSCHMKPRLDGHKESVATKSCGLLTDEFRDQHTVGAISTEGSDSCRPHSSAAAVDKQDPILPHLDSVLAGGGQGRRSRLPSVRLPRDVPRGGGGDGPLALSAGSFRQ